MTKQPSKSAARARAVAIAVGGAVAFGAWTGVSSGGPLPAEADARSGDPAVVVDTFLADEPEARPAGRVVGFVDQRAGLIRYSRADAADGARRRWGMPVFRDRDAARRGRPAFLLETREGRPTPEEFAAMRRGFVDGFVRIEVPGRILRRARADPEVDAALRRNGFVVTEATLILEPIVGSEPGR